MAHCTIEQVHTDFGCMKNDPVGFVQQFYSIALPFVAGIALIALMIGGYTLMVSQGDQQKVRAGKAWIFYAIGGLFLAIFGYVLIEVLAGDILKLPGYS